MTGEGSGPGGDRRKSIYDRHLRPKVYAPRTKIDHHLESKIEYNRGMKNEKNIDCNGDSWHIEAQDSDGLTIWQAWRVTFNGHQRNLSWHCSREDAQAFIDAGMGQAQRRSDEMAAEQRSAYEQAQADMAELRGPRGWV